LRLFECLLRLYPPRFRGEFSNEIRAVIVSRLSEAEERGRAARVAAVVQETAGLVISILRESWHEVKIRREKTMNPQDQLERESGGMPVLRPAENPGLPWFAGWTLLTTAALPTALVATAPLAVLFTWLVSLGAKASLWPAARSSTLEFPGFVISFALVLGSVQGYLLRRFLPQVGFWFVTTGAGILLGGLAIGSVLGQASVQSWDPFWMMAAMLLLVGLMLGLAHWLYLRRFVPNAFWIILIDVLGFGSILSAGSSYTSLAELLVLVLPGAITGLGLLLLLRQSRRKIPDRVSREAILTNRWRLPRLARIGLGIAVLVPVFFLCIWVYAASQLALAKGEGVYPTVEEAVITRNSEGFGGAQVVRIDSVRAGPNSRDEQPHVWFGTARVYMDRVPAGYTWDNYLAGSFYIRVREGWVHVPEGAFPEFIGWVMELYGMEGVSR
jgi:hypothetical protein